MKTVLDLLREFGALNDAKNHRGGSLPPEDERRWAELKTFYNQLMSQSGLAMDPGIPEFSVSDIRDQVTAWERLRVPVEIYVVLHYQGETHTARVVNLSRGGAFLASETLFEIGSPLTLYLSKIGSRYEDRVEMKGEVAWCTERGIPEDHLPCGMGIRFVELSRAAQEKLEGFLIEIIEKQLSGLW
jgi:Tfp pilus assembly protein PilZ